MDELELQLATGFSMTSAVHLDHLTDQLMAAVESCSRSGISFPRIWEEVEDALDLVPADLPTEWRIALRTHLGDHVLCAFMNVSADAKSSPDM